MNEVYQEQSAELYCFGKEQNDLPLLILKVLPTVAKRIWCQFPARHAKFFFSVVHVPVQVSVFCVLRVYTEVSCFKFVH
jgi:hypothetical protein